LPSERTSSAFLASVLFAVFSRVAHGQPPAPAPNVAAVSKATALPVSTKDEARRRFDRGLALYNAGDLPGALAEFRLAYRLTGHPIVLYNLALVRAGLGQAAEALESLERLQSGAAHAELGPERAERARKVYEEQLLRVGSIEIKTDVSRAQVRVDNVDVAKTPTPPVRVTAGTHVISLSAPQYEPRHVSVTVAGRALEVLELNLTPLEQTLAHLMPSSSVPNVEVRVNGELVGQTPFASDVALRPGHYELEFSRAGYVPVKRRVSLDPGGTGRVDVPMVPSDAGLAAGGNVTFAISEPDSVVSVDGQPRPDHTLGLRLPLGRHTLRIQRAGFFDVDREVWVRRGSQSVDVTLLPTPDHLDEYVSGAKSQRFWSIFTMAGGALVTAGSAGFLIWNQGQKNEAEREFDAFASNVAQLPNGTCMTPLCEEKLRILVDELDQRRRRDVYGWVGVGVGAVSLGLGALFLARSPAPGRYDPKPESDVFGSLELRVRGSALEARTVF
jgi:hypothetical protein